MAKEISHGWETVEPDDPTRDVSARNLNDHEETYSGLTAGHVLRASAADAADFAAIQDGDLPSTIARDSEVTSAISALSSIYQPLDSDLTAIAALSTTAYGRSLLLLADAGALLAEAGGASAVHVHSGDDITSGTVADARVASTLARDSEISSGVASGISSHEGESDPHTGYVLEAATPGGELAGTYASPTVDASHSGSTHAATQAAAESTAAGALASHAADTTGIHGITDTAALLTTSAAAAAYQPLDSDLTAVAALTTTSFGRGLLELANQAALLSAAGASAASHSHAGEDITSGTVADGRVASTIARDSETTSAISALSSVYQPLDSDLTSIAALTTTSFGRGLLILADAAALLSAAGAAASGHNHTGVYATAAHTHTFSVALPFTIDGGGSVIATGRKVGVEVPFAGTITACRIFADASGTFTATIKKAAYSGLPTMSSIVASAKPTLSGPAQKSEDVTLTGWTTSVSAGDWLELTVDTITVCTQVTVSLTVSRTV